MDFSVDEMFPVNLIYTSCHKAHIIGRIPSEVSEWTQIKYVQENELCEEYLLTSSVRFVRKCIERSLSTLRWNPTRNHNKIFLNNLSVQILERIIEDI